jgi:iron complex transport system permease protein
MTAYPHPRKIVLAGFALTLLLFASVCVALSVGPTRFTLLDLFRNGAEGGLGHDLILRVRLPRVVLGLLAGAALSAAGVAFQAILRNPLADPYILGISGGAALGAVLPLGLAAGSAAIYWTSLRPLTAFAGAVIATLAVIRLAGAQGRASSYPMLLIGWVANSFFFSLILFLETTLDLAELQGVLFWLVGSLSTPTWTAMTPLVIAVTVGLVWLFLLSGRLNLLSLGEEEARNLGVRVPLVRLSGILAASLITATVVSLTGMIGFLGLMVPHICRLLIGSDHRLLVPGAAVFGASFLIVADALARVVAAPTELPVGVITALTGGPFFLWLYRARRGGGSVG